MRLTGEKQVTNLDARDSLGRTPLSWCFRYPPDANGLWVYRAEAQKGIELLNFPQVDVNSRDNSGRTILEHLIRHLCPHGDLGGLTVSLFKSSALDVNLETSDRHSPLDLIISLYGTWPLEFGDIDAPWRVRTVDSEGRRASKNLKGVEKKSMFSDGLQKTAQLLLATQKVDVSEQKRCLAKAPDQLRDLILESIKEVEPDYHFQIVNDANY